MTDAVRYTRIFLLTALVGGLLVSGFNAVMERVIASNPNGPSLQLLSAFARNIKPAWMDDFRGDTVLVGTSRVRDGFDPILIKDRLRIDAFNYGVSGGTAYESLRYVQDALAHPNVKRVVIAADTFATGTANQPTGSGFVESSLAVTPAGKPTPWRAVHLFTARYMDGGALGLHAQSAVRLTRMGGDKPEQRPDLFTPYRRLDAKGLADARRHHRAHGLELTAWAQAILEKTFDQFCGGRAEAFVFFPPDHFAITSEWAANDLNGFIAFKSAVLQAAEARNRACGARIHVYDFETLNSVTGEVIAPGRPSVNYHEAVHFRPTIGLVILDRMLNGKIDAGYQDFGVELTGEPAAAARIGAIRQDLAHWTAAGH